MPSFRLNKLVRDGLREKYAALGQQAEYPKLTREEIIELLVQKVIEEVSEVKPDMAPDKAAYEIGDAQQALNDLRDLFGITPEQVDSAMQEVFDDKGGFAGGTYVGDLTLKDDDEWVDYYRKYPDRFPEIKE